MRKVVKVQIITEEHHRRPRSLGGSSDPSNIAYVTPDKHRAWHILFGNMHAEQICFLLNRSPHKPTGKTVVCKFQNDKRTDKYGKNNSKNKNKTSEAWKKLFGRLSFKNIIAYINSTWIDPSYRLYLEKENKPR